MSKLTILHSLILLLCFGGQSAWGIPAGSVRINEFLLINTSTIVDPDYKEYVGWRGAVQSAERNIHLTLIKDGTVEAVFVKDLFLPMIFR